VAKLTKQRPSLWWNLHCLLTRQRYLSSLPRAKSSRQQGDIGAEMLMGCFTIIFRKVSNFPKDLNTRLVYLLFDELASCFDKNCFGFIRKIGF
jgi:hypothetical protein